MRTHRLRCNSFLLPAVLLATTASVPAGSLAQSTLKGRAYGVYVDVPSVAAVSAFRAAAAGPVTIGDTGPLAPVPGVQSVTLTNYSLGPYLTADSLGVVTSSDEGCHGSSSVRLVNTTVLPGHAAEIYLSSLSGDEEDDCCLTSNQPDTYIIQGLSIGGTPITPSGAHNETVPLPGIGYVVLNEIVTLSPGDCDNDDFLVIAIHLVLDAGGARSLSGVRIPTPMTSVVPCPRSRPRGERSSQPIGDGYRR